MDDEEKNSGIENPDTIETTNPPVDQAVGDEENSSLQNESLPISNDDNLPGSEPVSENIKGGNRGKTIALIVSILLLIAGVLGYYFLFANTSSQQPMTESEVQEESTSVLTFIAGNISGEVFKVNDNGERVALSEGSAVLVNERLITMDESEVSLTAENGAKILLDELTDVSFSGFDREGVYMNVRYGLIFINTNNSVNFMVQAGDTFIKSLGTIFSVENKEEVSVLVYEKSVQIEKEGSILKVENNFQWRESLGASEELQGEVLGDSVFLQNALKNELDKLNQELIAKIMSELGETENKEEVRQAVKDLGVDKKELLKEAFSNTTSGQITSINLSGYGSFETGAVLSWSSDGLAQNGFRIVWSQTPGVSYPGDKRTSNPIYGYAKTLGPMKSGTWYYRVCEYTDNGCGSVYSNEVSVTF
jgi:hypothetical protein